MSADNHRIARSVTSPKGVIDHFVCFLCPEDGCDWHTGGWIIKYEQEALWNYHEHWKEVHAPKPPAPKEDRWDD